ncbi:MAG: 3-phosphoshikimate 1-carboxyvinyltransferase, partial [Holophagales bacterium]|nr:3-phosphoshikimate 1-carboxyvinyltransferase [Holophagales bacterium]
MAGLTASLPDPYPVRRAAGVSGVVEPPGSKSISHRALNLALIGRKPATIENLLEADDIGAFRAVLDAMGWRLRSASGSGLRVEPPPNDGTEDAARLDCRSAGTLLRLLVASCTVTPGEWILDGSPRLRERPIGPLVAALRRLGAEIDELGRPGCAPVRVRGGKLAGGRVEIDAGESSQYVSALLMAALNAEGPIEVLVPFLVSSPYVDTTLEVMADFGAPVAVRRDGEAREFRVEPRRPELVNGRYRVAGDDSAAAYPAAAAAICGGSVRLRGLSAE